MAARFTSLRCPLLAALVAAIPLLASPPAQAAPRPVPAKLDPRVVRALRSGINGAFHHGPPHPGRAPVIIELTAPATAASLTTLRRTGAALVEVDGEVVAYDRFVPADVDTSAALALAARPEVARISIVPARGPLPLDHSAQLIRLADARGARPALDYMTGKGVTVGDIDTLVDIFHPTFFRGDAGYYDWIDVDHDGVLTPGVDAIDLNRNGKVDPGEVAQVVTAETYSDETRASVPGRSSKFDPSIDWLYLDANRNQKRDYGAAAGFDDTTPAFGEPLFVPDDVNRNGHVDVGERVVRLGTSKFREFFVRLDYQPPGFKAPVNVSHVFTRGKDMATLHEDYFKDGIYGYADALHATGVATILAGDVPLVGRRWVGLVPEADLIEGWEVTETESLPISATTWALKQKPDVMLYEMAPWTGVELDGSDALSALIDTSSQTDGITHTCPTGDQGSARKHAQAMLAAGASTVLPVNIPDKDKLGQGPLTYVDVTLHVRGGAASTVTFTSPAGDTFDALTASSGALMGGALFYPTVQTTTRGTQMIDVVLYAPAASMPLPTGAWTVSVTGDAGAAVSVDAYVSDDKSSWGAGAEWDPSVATDTSTIGVPSTADHCIAVNAHPNHLASSSAPWFDVYYGDYEVPSNLMETQGQLRAYCPLGPRIDGVQKPDVTAPDNPWVAAEYDPSYDYDPYGAFRVFGGTSGASPHVTGTAALLAQAGIHGDAARDAIRLGAVSDAVTGMTPNAGYGYGRLDAAGALGVKAMGKDPTLALTISPAMPTTKDTVTITPSATSGDGSTTGLQIEWDDGYDGTWDVPWASVAPRTITSKTPATLPFKARVRNASGHVAEAVAWITFAAPPPPTTMPSTKGTDTDPNDCGCRTVGEARGRGAWALLGVAVLLGARRRRKRRRKAR